MQAMSTCVGAAVAALVAARNSSLSLPLFRNTYGYLQLATHSDRHHLARRGINWPLTATHRHRSSYARHSAAMAMVSEQLNGFYPSMPLIVLGDLVATQSRAAARVPPQRCLAVSLPGCQSAA